MTDDTVPRERSRGNTGWTEAEHRYRSAAEALRSATVDAAGEGADVDDAVASDHQLAGKLLLETPATHLGHVAIKIRAADNMLGLATSYPDLPGLLLKDIFGMMGLPEPDGAALPPRI